MKFRIFLIIMMGGVATFIVSRYLLDLGPYFSWLWALHSSFFILVFPDEKRYFRTFLFFMVGCFFLLSAHPDAKLVIFWSLLYILILSLIEVKFSIEKIIKTERKTKKRR